MCLFFLLYLVQTLLLLSLSFLKHFFLAITCIFSLFHRCGFQSSSKEPKVKRDIQGITVQTESILDNGIHVGSNLGVRRKRRQRKRRRRGRGEKIWKPDFYFWSQRNNWYQTYFSVLNNSKIGQNICSAWATKRTAFLIQRTFKRTPVFTLAFCLVHVPNHRSWRWSSSGKKYFCWPAEADASCGEMCWRKRTLRQDGRMGANVCGILWGPWPDPSQCRREAGLGKPNREQIPRVWVEISGIVLCETLEFQRRSWWVPQAFSGDSRRPHALV